MGPFEIDWQRVQSLGSRGKGDREERRKPGLRNGLRDRVCRPTVPISFSVWGMRSEWTGFTSSGPRDGSSGFPQLR